MGVECQQEPQRGPILHVRRQLQELVRYRTSKQPRSEMATSPVDTRTAERATCTLVMSVVFVLTVISMTRATSQDNHFMKQACSLLLDCAQEEKHYS